MLTWSTSQENNSKYFTVEKSSDGINYNFLGKLNGAGNSSVNRNYQLPDHTPFNGTNFYRLSQTDMDGNAHNYGIKSVNYKVSSSFTANIVNNGQGQISVAVKTAMPAAIYLKVVDLLGKEILSESFSVNSGGAVKNLHLSPGVYIIVLINDGGDRISNKVVVQ